MKPIIKSAIIAAALLSATAAHAADALVTTNLNMRTGPGTNYPVVGSIPNGARVNLAGCTSGYGWCQVNYAGRAGWASSRYLAVREGSSSNYSNNNFGTTAALIGIPLIAGLVIGSTINNNNNNNNNYWGRPHYRPGPPPPPPPHYRPGRPSKPSQPGWNNNRPSKPNRPGWDNGHRPDRPGAGNNRPGRPGWDNSRPTHSTKPIPPRGRTESGR